MGSRLQILTRLYVVLTLMGIVPVLIVVQVLRITYLQRDLRIEGVRQAESEITIPAMRGMLLDQNGRVLAINVRRFDVGVDPTVDGFPDLAQSFTRDLSRLTGRDVSQLRKAIRDASGRRFVLLARSIPETARDEIQSWNVPGVLVTERFVRRYNYGSTASHVVGHVDADMRGIAGLELQYDHVLTGTDGRRTVQRDRRGRIKTVVQGRVKEPEHGKHIVLTLDLIRQAIMDEELATGVEQSGAASGTAIAMDPSTGAILALSNVPTYDPNRPGAYPTEARRNRAITDRLEPGSTFKLVAAVAAVDRGIISPEDSIDTGPGYAIVRGRSIRDTHGHGRIPFREVISLSSNIGIAKVSLGLEPGVFYQYARNLGFGQPALVDLPGEVGGTLKKPADWSGLTQPWMSHGYEVEVTPLQMLTAYCALANGGLVVQPHIVSEIRSVRGEAEYVHQPDSIRRAFSRATADTLLRAFKDVVVDGTGKRAQVAGLDIAGKTGTAQKAKDGGYDRSAYRASFVGFFPADDPVVAMIVVLDEPRTSGYGGVVSAPIFANISRRWIATLPKVADRLAPPDTLEAPEEVPVPDVRLRPVSAARSALVSSGLRPAARETQQPERFALVAAQTPGSGTPVRTGSEVAIESLLRAGSGIESDRPHLVDVSCRHAVNWLLAKQIPVRVRGTGRVVKQESSANLTSLTCR